jgi:translocation protein SEC72
MDTFTQLPVVIDPVSKAVSGLASANPRLNEELTTLNALHKSILSLETPAPPPPVPVNPKRSAQIQKLRESGNVSYKKAAYGDAVKMYSLGIQMALGRPGWEPAALVREELSVLYSNRAQAHMGMQAWPEALNDAELSVEMKPQANSKAWWRKGRALVEMGRLEEARGWVGRALEFEGRDEGLLSLLKEIDTALEKRAAAGA